MLQSSLRSIQLTLGFTHRSRRQVHRFVIAVAYAAWLLAMTWSASAQPVKRYNGSGSDVMLQGFHWTSYDPARNGNKHWYTVVKENADTIRNAGFTAVWFPPPSASSAGDNGYLPNEWFKLENGCGTEQELRDAIAALGSTRAIADVVINHRCGTHGWSDFSNPAFGPAQTDNDKAVVTGDECHCGQGAREERHRDGTGSESNDAGRDLDHTNPAVQEQIKAYLAKLKDVGFSGWRYDQVRGYNGSYVGLYNDASDPFLSVGEFWDNRAQPVIDWIDESDGKSMAFDFPTRNELVVATLHGDYGRLKTLAGKPPGVIGYWPEMAVTFIENHDTEAVRDGGNKRFPDDKVMQGYCYLLTHPGIPCVFWRHFFDQGDAQKEQLIKLIALRKQAGLTSRSVVFIEPDTNGKYAAKIDDTVAVKLGPAAWSPGDGWEVVVDGPDYAVWRKR